MATDNRAPAFRLDREPWIPVLYVDGSAGQVSLTTLFAEASRIRDISGDIPQQKLPILRLALAILYRVFSDSDMSNPEMLRMWRDMWRAGRFDMDAITAYLDYFGSRFDLFDAERPFFQVAGLEYVDGKPDGVDELIADTPKPEKYLFSMRVQAANDRLSFAEAARWLVFLQAYGTAGIKTPVVGNTHVNKGKVYAPKDSVGTGWLGAIGGIFLQGDTLFQTLLLNWVFYDKPQDAGRGLLGNESDLPAWERELPSSPADIVEAYRDPSFGIGPAALMTWQSRRVRLIPDEEGSSVVGVVCCYGDILRPINMQFAETMTRWRESTAQQKKLGTADVPWMPFQHDPEKALWRGLASLLSVEGVKQGLSPDLRPGVIRWMEEIQYHETVDLPPLVAVCAQGMSYGTQNSVFEDGINDFFDVSVSMMRRDSPAVAGAVEIVNDTDKAVQALVNLVREIGESAGDKRSGSRASVSSADIVARAYSELDDLFRERLAHFTPDKDADDYCHQWGKEVRRRVLALGEEYADAADVSLFAYREKTIGKKTFSISAGTAIARFRRRINEVFPLERSAEAAIGGRGE